ncbi:hypothetical protein GON09_002599 [Rhodococcus sp. B50]|nr:hypothetical protein [Rhodococcus sp. B50]
MKERRDTLERWWSNLDEDKRKTFVANRDKRIPPQYREDVRDAYGLVTSTTAGAGTAPDQTSFRFVPIAQHFLEWKASQ